MARDNIGINQIAEDMDLELMDLYPNSKESRFKAIEIISFLAQGPKRTETILEQLYGEISPKTTTACSRTLNKLFTHGYVSYEGKGLEKVWRIRSQSTN
jgi:hypothetical protein